MRIATTTFAGMLGVLVIGIGAAQAADGGALTSAHSQSTITIPKGYSFTMPKTGRPLTGPSNPVAIPVGIPIGRENLERLKKSQSNSSAAPASIDLVKQASAPSRQDVQTSCSNVGAAAGFAPSDSHGAVGKLNFVTVKNVTIGVYSKSTCAPVVAETSLKTFFAAAGVPSTATLFDPRVLYDRFENRFFVTVESSDSGNNDQYQYFAVSKDGLGTSWWLYRITLSEGSTVFCKQSANSFWDYPSAGSSRGTATNVARWFITANDFGTSSTTGAILSIAKAASTSGGSVAVSCFNNLSDVNIAPPIVLDLASNIMFLSPGSGGGSVIRRLRLTESSSGPGSDTLTIIANVNIPAWSAPPNAAQPNGTTLDSLDGRFQSASIQSRGAVWNVHTIGLSGFARIRLYKVSQAISATAPLMTFTPITTVNDHLFNPSFATGSGAVNAPAFMTATRTIPSNATTGKASTIMFAGLNASPATTNWQFYVTGVSATQFAGCSVCRWGDYSATQIDPSSSGMAWGFNQLVTGTTEFNWMMHAAAVTLNLPYAPVANSED